MNHGVYEQVLATHGAGTFVIRLSEKVYVFAGKKAGGHCEFSFDPWSFYKFGYFTEADDYTDLNEVFRCIEQDVQKLTPENEWQYLCSLVTAEEVKKAWEDFKQRYDLHF